MNLLDFFALLLSGIGLWISVYFTGVSYHLFPADVKCIPQVCQLKEKTCQMVLQTPNARLFGIPNSVYGMFLYAYLIFYFAGLPLPKMLALIGISLAALRSLYLAYSLIFLIKVPCPLCFTSHVINLLLFIYLAFGR